MVRKTVLTEKNKCEELRAVVCAAFRPPPQETVSEWADKHRILTSEASAEPGPWRTDRAPYQREIMDAFTTPGIYEVVVMSGAQIGKSDVLNNMIGRLIDDDPGPALMVQPTKELAADYSIRRIAPMIAACKSLREKVGDALAKTTTNTIHTKSFPGGSLTLIGANSPRELRSRPIRYLFFDELDAFPHSVGTEGDPVALAEKRTATFYNRRIVKTSTPLIKGKSKIESAYKAGTQEEWRIKCPACGDYHFIYFKDIKYTYTETQRGGGKEYVVNTVEWCCPTCRAISPEHKVKRAQGKWVANNPNAKGIRSFHLNSFSSPWEPWSKHVQQYLDSKDDPVKYQVFVNTILGLPYEEGNLPGEAEEMLARREVYDDEVPDGALVLTCGVDTQDNRLEYEVVGWGRADESWGIQRGFIMGRPDQEEVWEELDKILDRYWEAREGATFKISATFVDSGGHYTEHVYEQCRRRAHKNVYAIKGEGGTSKTLVRPSQSKQFNRFTGKKDVTLLLIGVDNGKKAIMHATSIKQAGAYYMHFPIDGACGYDKQFFKGLLTEEEVTAVKNGQVVYKWVKHGTARNEALDCRNYARAAFKAFAFDLAAVERALIGQREPKPIMPGSEKKQVKYGKLSGGVKV